MTGRTEILYRQLRGELMRFSVGERFHSQRRLIEQFGVSNRVVMAVIDRMAEEDLLERRERSGYYVRNTNFRRSVAYFHHEDAFGKTKRIEQELKDAFDALGGYELAALPYRDGASLRSELESCTADVILVSWGKQFDFELLNWASRTSKIVIFESRDLRDVGLHCFYDDIGYNTLLALNTLAHYGHRKIGILITGVPTPLPISRSLMTFARILKFQLIEINCPIQCEGSAIERGYLALSRHLEQNELDFSALFLETGIAAPGALRALAEHGYSVPDDVSILGFQHAEYCSFLTPAITAIGGNGPATARARVAAINQFLSSPDSGPIAVPYRATLIQGQSMKYIPKAT